MVLKFLSHSFQLTLLSSLSLLSLSFLAPLFYIIFWFFPPLPPIWQDNLHVKQPSQPSNGSPPLLLGMDGQF